MSNDCRSRDQKQNFRFLYNLDRTRAASKNFIFMHNFDLDVKADAQIKVVPLSDRRVFVASYDRPIFENESELQERLKNTSAVYTDKFGDPVTVYISDEYEDACVSVAEFAFSEKSIRQAFVRKVFSILTIQLGFSLILIAWFTLHKPTKRFLQDQGPILYVPPLLLLMVSLMILACSGNGRRKTPWNYIILSIFTVSQGFLLAEFASMFEVAEVLIAIAITAILCASIMIFAVQTKFDFTTCWGIGIALGAILPSLLIVWLTFEIEEGRLMFTGLGAFIGAVFLIVDTQMIVNGVHAYSITPEEYIFAALILYLDIIRIFYYVLRFIRNFQ